MCAWLCGTIFTIIYSENANVKNSYIKIPNKQLNEIRNKCRYDFLVDP